MNNFLLKVNHIVFHWYYSRCGEHFKQWTFLKSVKLLIQNYNHTQLLLRNAEKIESFAIKEADKERKMRLQLEMQLMADDSLIGSVNRIFGLGLPKSENN